MITQIDLLRTLGALVGSEVRLRIAWKFTRRFDGKVTQGEKDYCHEATSRRRCRKENWLIGFPTYRKGLLIEKKSKYLKWAISLKLSVSTIWNRSRENKTNLSESNPEKLAENWFRVIRAKKRDKQQTRFSNWIEIGKKFVSTQRKTVFPGFSVFKEFLVLMKYHEEKSISEGWLVWPILPKRGSGTCYMAFWKINILYRVKILAAEINTIGMIIFLSRFHPDFRDRLVALKNQLNLMNLFPK